MAKSADSLSLTLDKLQLGSKSSKSEVADSWEDEIEDDTELRTPISDAVSPGNPVAPPPTPSSPSYNSRATMKSSSYQTQFPYGMDGSVFDNLGQEPNGPSQGRMGNEKRPEKSTAVASRLIAAGIGQAAPRRTKEQREYDQAMRLQEKKKRDQAREEEERKKQEKERAKQAIIDISSIDSQTVEHGTTCREACTHHQMNQLCWLRRECASILLSCKPFSRRDDCHKPVRTIRSDTADVVFQVRAKVYRRTTYTISLGGVTAARVHLRQLEMRVLHSYSSCGREGKREWDPSKVWFRTCRGPQLRVGLGS
nr:hypothetical protein CFP56_00764 [Quercus suber]